MMLKGQQAAQQRHVGQRHMELQALANAVIKPLSSGLHSFNNVSEMLLSVNADIVLPDCQAFEKMRREIENMKHQMEASEKVAQAELKKLDEKTEHLTAEESTLARKKCETEAELKSLQTKLESNEQQLKMYEASLATKTTALRQAEQTLENEKRNYDYANNVRDVGIGLFAIPIFGWIAGSVMTGVGQTDMNNASWAADVARKEASDCRSNVSYYSGKVSEYKNQISRSQQNITTTNSKIRETGASLKRMSEMREVVADIQAKVRKAVHHLGKLSGVASVAELQTRRMILLEPVMKVMDEMMSALDQIAGEQLKSRSLQGLMQNMRRNHAQLMEKAASDNSDSDANHYY